MVNMLEEGLVAGAEIVQTRFSIGSVDEPVARTFAVAGELDFALPAVARQCVLLVIPEFPLLVRCDELYQVLLFDIAQKILWLDKMVARI